jgi:hypothetical protein
LINRVRGIAQESGAALVFARGPALIAKLRVALAGSYT